MADIVASVPLLHMRTFGSTHELHDEFRHLDFVGIRSAERRAAFERGGDRGFDARMIVPVNRGPHVQTKSINSRSSAVMSVAPRAAFTKKRRAADGNGRRGPGELRSDELRVARARESVGGLIHR